MGMAYKNVAYWTLGDCGEKSLKMRFVLWTRIDNGERIGPYDIAVCAMKCKSARIIRSQAEQVFTQGNRFPVFRGEAAVEIKRH
ncbi:hypothetical protein D9M69_678790 [compost metagenome]